MDQFDRKDMDEEVPAHITLEKGGHGSFQFLLVSSEMDGEYKASSGEGECVFDFTWMGNDECNEACGDGWMEFLTGACAEGEFRFHRGDTYTVQGSQKNNESA